MEIRLHEISETLYTVSEYDETPIGNGVPVLADWEYQWPEPGDGFTSEQVAVCCVRIALPGAWMGFVHHIEKDFTEWAANQVSDWLNDHWSELDDIPADYRNWRPE